MKKVLAFLRKMWYYTRALRSASKYPGVAKFGIALEWGSRGRWFESSHSDQGLSKDSPFSFYYCIPDEAVIKSWRANIRSKQRIP